MFTVKRIQTVATDSIPLYQHFWTSVYDVTDCVFSVRAQKGAQVALATIPNLSNSLSWEIALEHDGIKVISYGSGTEQQFSAEGLLNPDTAVSVWVAWGNHTVQVNESIVPCFSVSTVLYILGISDIDEALTYCRFVAPRHERVKITHC